MAQEEEIREITLPKPDDWHHHLRDGPVLVNTVHAAQKQFKRAIVMPNLTPPVTNLKQAKEYKNRILDALQMATQTVNTQTFQPLMTLYLTDDTTPEMIKEAANSGDVAAVKLYPAGATTNSDSGVTNYDKIRSSLEAMQHYGLPLCVHGEVTHPKIDVFDRERVFVKEMLPKLRNFAPQLKIVLEHLTTKDAVEAVVHGDSRLAGTITPQHLLATRNDLLVGGIKPHLYCLPILKSEDDRLALIDAIRSGCNRLFLGTDSAPHSVTRKESACGCAGVFSAGTALELYATAFEEAGMLYRLEAFASMHGASFYGLPFNKEMVTLRREPLHVPETYPFGDEVVVPFRAGSILNWKLVAEAAS